MDYEAFGKQVRKARRVRNMTQEKLAEKVSISASFLGHVERGSRKASLETLINLSNALEISPNDLLRDSFAYKPLPGLDPDTAAKIYKYLFERM